LGAQDIKTNRLVLVHGNGKWLMGLTIKVDAVTTAIILKESLNYASNLIIDLGADYFKSNI